jgi:hypothetical protein
MNLGIVLQFAKKLLPMAKIGSYILSIMALGVAALLGANKDAIQADFCASKIPDAPKIEAPVAPAVVVPVAPDKK